MPHETGHEKVTKVLVPKADKCRVAGTEWNSVQTVPYSSVDEI